MIACPSCESRYVTHVNIDLFVCNECDMEFEGDE